MTNIATDVAAAIKWRIQFAPIAPSDSNQIRNALPSDRALQFVSMAQTRVT
jgi:hypothetical protein